MKAHKLSLEQIEMMKHTIGFSSDRVTGRKHRKYEAFRNYYTTGKPEPELEELVEVGLMVSRPYPMGCGENPQVYFVSEAGFTYLSKLLDVAVAAQG